MEQRDRELTRAWHAARHDMKKACALAQASEDEIMAALHRCGLIDEDGTPFEYQTEFAKFLKAANVTAQSVSKRYGIGYNIVSNWRIGKTQCPDYVLTMLRELYSCPTGYQQGILVALGSWNGDRLYVRSIDRWYPDQMQTLFRSRVYSLDDAHVSGRRQYIIKSPSAHIPTLDEVVDWKGFARAYIEIHGAITPITQHKKHVPGMKIYGREHVVEVLMAHLPIEPKKIYKIENSVDSDKYIGTTYGITIQKKETKAVLDWIDGEPKNPSVWNRWDEKIKKIKSMDKIGDS